VRHASIRCHNEECVTIPCLLITILVPRSIQFQQTNAPLPQFQGIPNKGPLLTLISSFWFSYLTTNIPHLRTHFLSLGLPASLASSVPDSTITTQQLQRRSCVVRRLKVLPVESIVRGYITGSAWESYRKTGEVNGEKLKEGLRESERLETAIWTPSTKAEVGGKDENISREQGKSYEYWHLLEE